MPGRKEVPRACNSPTTHTCLRASLQTRKMDFKWLEKLNHEKNMGGKIDGVGKHTYNLELDFRLIGKAEGEACGPHGGGGGTYRIYYIFAFYLKGQSPSFFPLLALFVHRAISYMKTSERTKAAFGGESVGSQRSARLGGGGAVATALTAAPDPALDTLRKSPAPPRTRSCAFGAWPQETVLGREGRAGHAWGWGLPEAGSRARPRGPVLLQSLQEPFAGHRTLGLAKEAL